ncbi:MAG TPA: DUF4157 domain-containing protein [Leptolyngbyaceae cyanobacterium M33_DOE_097]|uniref:DUF4157 domain-containing protein n=1 Tax=Oscillatoriales cyanobacterium SpSt-418 TaxID=2282169 RepID=A0A7C3PGX2_9CYAN|nr:DUF4157 domain-containing protein [Leptolyngbyaceae cyanobacterium M33_DOE_097]
MSLGSISLTLPPGYQITDPVSRSSASTLPAATTFGSTPTPSVPAGTGPQTPDTATPEDLLNAILAVPSIDSAITELRSQAESRLYRDWNRLRLGEQIGVISAFGAVGAGAITGIISDPSTRHWVLEQLNSRILPVPGVPWLRAEINTQSDGLILGLHLDLGTLLPPILGFGPGSPSPIGGPPQPEPFIPGAPAVQFAREPQAASPSDRAVNLEDRLISTQGTGNPLSKEVRAFMEPRFGSDFGHVRVHTGSEAVQMNRELSAQAFTHGHNIYFNAGKYDPATNKGKELLAHELTHVVQQTSNTVNRTIQRRLFGEQVRFDSLPEAPPRATLLGPYSDTAIAQELYGDSSVRIVHTAQDYSVIEILYDRLLDRWKPYFSGSIQENPVESVDRRITQLCITPQYATRLTDVELIEQLQIIREHRATLQPNSSAYQSAQANFTILQDEQTRRTERYRGEGNPSLSIDQLNDRLNLITQILARLAERYRNEPEALQKIQQAQNRLTWARTNLGVSNAPLFSQFIGTSQQVLAQAESTLSQLDRQRATFSSQPQFERSRSEYIEQVDRVRGFYFEAIGAVLRKNTSEVYNRADQAAQGLSRALTDVDLNWLSSRQPTYQMLEPARQSLIAWVGWIRERLDALEVNAQELAIARRNRVPNLAEREAQFRNQAEIIQLSLEGLEHLERAMQAYEYLANQGNILFPSAYGDVGRIIQRCDAMKEAAFNGNVALLRQRVERHRNDPDVATFYRGLPLIVFGSRFAVTLGITLAAAIASAGLGGLVAGAIGTPATTTGAVLATGGAIAVEALTFTLVSHGLQSVIPGQQPTSGFWEELAWSIGLFTVLRGLSSAVRSGVSLTGVTALQGPAQMIASFPLLHGYGLLRFRVSEGHWPNDEEIEMMTAQNLIMLAGLSVGMRVAERWMPGRQSPTALQNFQRTYGRQFELLEVARQRLRSDLTELVQQGRANDQAALNEIQARARVVEEEFNRVLSEVQADATVNLAQIRTELKNAREMAIEGSSELLQRELGFANDVGLQRAGGERQYTYSWGKTGEIAERLSGLGGRVETSVDPGTGLRTLTTRFGEGEPAVTFQERSSPYPAGREVNLDPSEPLILRLLGEFSISDPVVQREVMRMLTIERAKNPTHPLQSSIRVVRRLLRDLQTKNAHRTVEEQLRDLRNQGRVASQAPPALVAAARQLENMGILRSPEWLSARDPNNFMGVVAEWLAYADMSAATATSGGTVLRGVKFRGTLFEDLLMTQPYVDPVTGRAVRNWEVAPELDLLAGTQVGNRFEYDVLGNVKAAQPGGSAAAAQRHATTQNQQSLEALRAHVEHRAVITSRGGQQLYGRIDSIEARGPNGETMALTGQISEVSGGARTETIGAKDSRGGFSNEMQHTYREISTIGEILRESQLKNTSGY